MINQKGIIMIWIVSIMVINLCIGIFIGAFIMHRKDRSLLKDRKTLYHELQNNKFKLNEYQKKLSKHFNHNIELLNKIAENYQDLYQNMIKNANFFLPNTHDYNKMYTFHTNDTHEKNKEKLPVEVPRDYSDNTEILKRKDHDIF